MWADSLNESGRNTFSGARGGAADRCGLRVRQGLEGLRHLPQGRVLAAGRGEPPGLIRVQAERPVPHQVLLELPASPDQAFQRLHRPGPGRPGNVVGERRAAARCSRSTGRICARCGPRGRDVCRVVHGREVQQALWLVTPRSMASRPRVEGFPARLASRCRTHLVQGLAQFTLQLVVRAGGWAQVRDQQDHEGGIDAGGENPEHEPGQGFRYTRC